MTAIIGLIHRDDVWMACDGITSDDDAGVYRMKNTYKLFTKKTPYGEMGVGCSGMLKLGEILYYSWEPSTRPGVNLEQYMHNVTDSIMECLKSHPMNEALFSVGDIKELDGGIIFGLRGRLFAMDGVGSLVEHVENYICSGNCGEIANGAMYVLTEKMKEAPEEALRIALDACSRHRMAGEPYTFLKLGGK